jgi:hypothetical protein
MSDCIAIVIVLQLSNLSGAPPPIVERAQREVTRMYAVIGVSIQWAAPASTAPVATPPATTPPAQAIRVVLLSRETGDLRLSADTVMGAAVRTPAGTGLAYVFYRGVEERADAYAVSSALVLACAMAHELGHLLLPSREHAADGLMRAHWRRDEFRQADQGQLRFSADEGQRIRARMAHLPPVSEAPTKGHTRADDGHGGVRECVKSKLRRDAEM